MEKEEERERKTKKKKRKQKSRAKADRDSKQPRRVQATTDSISDLAKEILARLVLVEDNKNKEFLCKFEGVTQAGKNLMFSYLPILQDLSVDSMPSFSSLV